MTERITTYQEEIERWRAQVEATLRADDGWLTVAGLFWLAEGANRVGSDPAAAVVLPARAPAFVGTLEREDREITFVPAANVPVAVNGAAIQLPTRLHSDEEGEPDQVTLGDLTFFIIERGERIGVRLRDKQSVARQAFRGRVWFPIDEHYRLDGRFVAYETPKPMMITNMLGDSEQIDSPGYVEFTLDGQTHTLDVSSQSTRGLWIVFRDQTAGVETYPAARFLSVPLLADGRVVVDFNRAVSPPCAFTEYATCPLPAPQNRLPVRVPAGERYH